MRDDITSKKRRKYKWRKRRYEAREETEARTDLKRCTLLQRERERERERERGIGRRGDKAKRAKP